MTGTLRALGSVAAAVALLVLAEAASAQFTPDASSVVGSWYIDYPTMLAELTPEEQAAADPNMTDKTVDMVFNSDNTGVRTETMSGETEVFNATWSVTNIAGNVVSIDITDSSGTSSNDWTFVDADTINWTVLGLPCSVILRRSP